MAGFRGRGKWLMRCDTLSYIGNVVARGYFFSASRQPRKSKRRKKKRAFFQSPLRVSCSPLRRKKITSGSQGKALVVTECDQKYIISMVYHTPYFTTISQVCAVQAVLWRKQQKPETESKATTSKATEVQRLEVEPGRLYLMLIVFLTKQKCQNNLTFSLALTQQTYFRKDSV